MNISSARCSGRAWSRSPRPTRRWRRPPAATSAASTIGTPDDLVKIIKNLMRGLGRLRHHHRLRARLGQPGEHPPQLGHGGALRDPGDQRLRHQAARVAEVPDREPRGVRARGPGRDGQDHGERKGRRGACRKPARAGSRSRPSTRRTCRRKRRSARRNGGRQDSESNDAARMQSAPLSFGGAYFE